MSISARNPKGTRDFGPEEMARRWFIIDTLKSSFRLFGFQGIETPSFELSETLLGKYGEEGDRLIFRVLNSGQKLLKADLEAIKENRLGAFASSLSEKALRYDLTIPFARYVVQHQHEIQLPFKRFQIQPVWRADRPQKGRFQEFYQCDADAVGSKSLWQEIEFILLYDDAFGKLGFSSVYLQVNHRKLLSAIAESMGLKDRVAELTMALDKLDKIGVDEVKNELLERGFREDAVHKIDPLLKLKGGWKEKLAYMREMVGSLPDGAAALDELEFILSQVCQIGLGTVQIDLNVTLARGLDYYTGIIFEVKAPPQVELGSIGGGGRYDDLTGVFGLKGIGGIGISFGLDRIQLAMEELSLFKNDKTSTAQILILNLGEKEAKKSFGLAASLRSIGIATAFYPEPSKLSKQLKYADKLGIPLAIIIGEEEISQGTCIVKDMVSGAQHSVPLEKAKSLIPGILKSL